MKAAGAKNVWRGGLEGSPPSKSNFFVFFSESLYLVEMKVVVPKMSGGGV
jgi:hypothetical protein